MPFYIRDPETDTLVRELAKRQGVGLTEAVKLAVRSQLENGAPKESLHERVRKITDEIAKYPDTGVTLDKKFFDELSGD
jgi:antitoxin VapB